MPLPWRTNNGAQNWHFPRSEMLVQLTLQKGGFRQGNPMPLKGDSDCCCCCPQRHGPAGRGNTMALRRMESKIGVSRRRNVPSKNRLEKACYTFYVSQCWLCWLLARCRCSYCYWCCWNPRQKSSIGAAAAAGAADPSKRQLPARKPHATEGRQRLLLCPQRHGPAGRRNTMALKDERSPKYTLYTPVTGLDLLCKHVQSS